MTTRKHNRRAEVFAWLHTPMTRQQLADTIGCDNRNASVHVGRLVELGVVRIVGNAKVAFGYTPLFQSVPGAVLPPVKRINPAITKRRRLVLSLMRDAGPQTRAGVSEFSGTSLSAAACLLGLMRRHGLIEFDGFDAHVGGGSAASRWRITAKGREAVK